MLDGSAKVRHSWQLISPDSVKAQPMVKPIAPYMLPPRPGTTGPGTLVDPAAATVPPMRDTVDDFAPAPANWREAAVGAVLAACVVATVVLVAHIYDDRRIIALPRAEWQCAQSELVPVRDPGLQGATRCIEYVRASK
jgi:hypothetical protein